MIGERLQELRKDKGLTQYDLAEQLGLSYHTISSYERDKSIPNDETKIKIANFFNISLDYLLGIKRERIPLQSTNKNIIVLPNSFNDVDYQKVVEYIEFLRYKKDYK